MNILTDFFSFHLDAADDLHFIFDILDHNVLGRLWRGSEAIVPGSTLPPVRPSSVNLLLWEITSWGER